MAWLKIDDGFLEHERIEPLTDKALRLHLAGLLLSARKLTDGHISAKDVRIVTVQTGSRRRHLDELDQAGLWIVNGDGYEIHDYLDYNPPAEDVKEERRKAAERMRALRSKGSRKP